MESHGPSSDHDRFEQEGSRGLLRRPGVCFGACVGLLAGAAVAWACCWLMERPEWLWQMTALGAAIGLACGAAIGNRQRWLDGKLVGPDIATTICTSYAVWPGLIVVFGGVPAVRGKLSLHLLAAAFFAGPMCGMIIGAALDRMYDYVIRRPQ